eukprot:GHRR01009186.1.p1 GENE.GHRR01009186.1~~GHRR01009186.1.p1  ORF type:complete len:144 (+),score=41.31 GHRR01009186.1:739-1170(+)
MANKLYTIGHSTRLLEELISMLQRNEVTLLADVRTIPKSGTNPQFNTDSLAGELQQHGIQYKWLGPQLGGLRRRNKDSELNAGWDNASFRGYADYMQTDEFKEGIQELTQLAGAEGPVAIMCAEAVRADSLNRTQAHAAVESV